ncbi:carboxylesterase/lipase family protein [Terriglobus roseus]|nr:carboxylesterase family protein [Terriglobus roseus]
MSVAPPTGEAVTGNGVEIALGIPYAQPPVGTLRFSAPVPVREGTPSLHKLPPPAMQSGRAGCSEDCLYLNVYAPDLATQGAGPFPVYVWIHGGGFTGGSPNDVNGSVFAKQGIVCITVAYRLGIFGFLDWSPLLGPDYGDSANNAVRDLILALKWVQKNVRAYGGDPSRVTIGGESAGAKLVASLMAIEEAKPLFRSMISESGGGERILDTATSAHVTEAFAAQLKDRTPGGIQAANAAALLQAQVAMTDAWPANFPLRTEADGALLPHRILPAIAAGNTSGKRLLIGTNRDENALYLGEHAAEPIKQQRLANATEAEFNAQLARYRKLYPTMSTADINIRALTAEEYWVPSIRVAQAHAKGGGSTWFYRLDEAAATGPHKGLSYHSYDLGYVWETLSAAEPPSAHVLERQMHDAWVAFIKGEPPAASGLPPWPKWDPQQRPTMLFNRTSTVERQPFESELRLWDNFRFE